MDKIEQQIAKFKSLDIWALTMDILIENKELIISMNKENLFKGQTSEGAKIHPNYFEDSYFKTPGQAKGYAIFKSKLNRNPYFTEKGFSIPDFFITGELVHDMIDAYISGDVILIEAKGEASDFDNKWKNIYGVTEENLETLRAIVKEKLPILVKKHLGYAA